MFDYNLCRPFDIEKSMYKTSILSLAILSAAVLPAAEAEGARDIGSVPQDLQTPAMDEGEPAAGKRVRVVAQRYAGTEVHHCLYLPTDWQAGKKYPVIVEYPGNGPYRDAHGDTCSGKVEDCNLGYGISGGEGVIWVCLPLVSKNHGQNQLMWWGDVEASVAYCRAVVAQVCDEHGGNPDAVFFAGLSRGSIACNYIGLHDDEIAKLWRGFICHSHYDGVTRWGYAGSDRASAAARLSRLQGRPQFISNEKSVDQTEQYLQKADPKGRFTFQVLPYHNHTDSWVLRDIPERNAVREWFAEALSDNDR